MNGAIQPLNNWAQYSTSISNLTFLVSERTECQNEKYSPYKIVHEPAADHSFTAKRQIQETQL